MIYDITIPVREGLAVWPGDTEYRFTQAQWGAIAVGAVTLSLHTGTHVDAPSHFLPSGATIENIALETYCGPCLVLDVSGIDEITPELLPNLLPERVLFRTLAWTDHTTFPTEVPILTQETIAALSERGVRLVGVDVPSVDRIESKELPIHHALASAGIHILESVDLRAIAPGHYHLIALPLRLVGGDASPVRAVLQTSTG